VAAVGAEAAGLLALGLIDRIAALVPPPRTHRHRYFGVLAQNSPLRAAVTAMATPTPTQTAMRECAPGAVLLGNALPPTPESAAPAKRSPTHYLWAVLIARIYEVFPLMCPMSYAPGLPGAPPNPLVNSALWRWIGQVRPYCGLGAGFYVG
jgi:hypothetical protein